MIRLVAALTLVLAASPAGATVSECPAEMEPIEREIAGAEAGISQLTRTFGEWSKRFDDALGGRDVAGAYSAITGGRLAFEQWSRAGLRLVNACSCYLLRAQSDDIGCRKKQHDVIEAIIVSRGWLDIEADVAWRVPASPSPP